jgi:hypothetical protein
MYLNLEKTVSVKDNMIKAHLIRTAEVDEEVFASVVQYLQQFKGEVEFIAHEDIFPLEGKASRTLKITDKDFDTAEPLQEMDFCLKLESPRIRPEDLDFPKVKAYPWDRFFSLIKKFRGAKEISLESQNPIPKLETPSQEHRVRNEDHVFILTYQANTEKWFVGTEMHNGRNHFIHLLYWHHYLMSEPVYPVAYHIISTILRNQTFDNYKGYYPLYHEQPKGCMMDLCLDKKDIILKMRTADICPECMRAMKSVDVNPKLLRQTLQIFDHVRAQVLFRERFLGDSDYSRLVIDTQMGELIFPEMSDLRIRLNPLEMTVYLFFIRHVNGVILSYLPDYFQELLSIYQKLVPQLDGDEAASRISDLTNPLSNSISEKISRIKSKLKNMLGEEIAEAYWISGPNGGIKKIGISREMVEEKRN